MARTPKTRRSELSAYELRYVRRRDKLNSIARQRGLPYKITPREFAAVKAKISGLHAQGMTYAMMARQSGLPHATLTRPFSKTSKTNVTGMFRPSYNAIMALQFEEPEPVKYGGGAHISAVGTLRKLRGLFAAGYGGQFMADRLEWRIQQINHLARFGAGYVSASTRQKIDVFYEKYAHVDPVEAGMAPTSVKRAKTAARNNGWAPLTCWDDDTIDDPLAHPEWTGACGQIVGVMIHLRENIPFCERCDRIANHTYSKVDPIKLFEAYPTHDTAQLAKLFNVDRGLIHRYTRPLAERSRHEISSVDLVGMKGFCERCGTVPIATAGRRSDGQVKLACRNAVTESKNGKKT